MNRLKVYFERTQSFASGIDDGEGEKKGIKRKDISG